MLHHHLFNVRFRPDRRFRVFSANALVGRFLEIPPLRWSLSSTSLLSSPSHFLSSSTHCFQVFFSLSLPVCPSTSSSLHFDIHFFLGIRSTWSYHPSLPLLTTAPISTTCNRFNNSLFDLLYFNFTPHIHLTIDHTGHKKFRNN